METGIHFFKLVLTNTTRRNPTEFLGGMPHPLDPDAWRVGFNRGPIKSRGSDG